MTSEIEKVQTTPSMPVPFRRKRDRDVFDVATWDQNQKSFKMNIPNDGEPL